MGQAALSRHGSADKPPEAGGSSLRSDEATAIKVRKTRCTTGINARPRGKRRCADSLGGCDIFFFTCCLPPFQPARGRSRATSPTMSAHLAQLTRTSHRTTSAPPSASPATPQDDPSVHVVDEPAQSSPDTRVRLARHRARLSRGGRSNAASGTRCDLELKMVSGRDELSRLDLDHAHAPLIVD
jgi:hypothetical protein